MDHFGVVKLLLWYAEDLPFYRVDLTQAEQNHLQQLISKGKTSAPKITRARILLLAHQSKSDAAISEALHSGRATVERTRKRTRKRCVEEGLEACLNWKPASKSVRALVKRLNWMASNRL